MIGKKIYYELTTGTTILMIPQKHSENAVNTTKEQDFIMFDVLNGRNPSQVGVKQLDYMQYENNFEMATTFMIDINTNEVLFQYPVFKVSQSDIIEALKSENVVLKADNIKLKEDVATNAGAIDFIIMNF